MCYISCVGDKCYDYDDELEYYNKALNDFKRLVFDKNNNIVTLINKDNYRNNITLLVSDINIIISRNNNWIDGNDMLRDYKLSIHKAKNRIIIKNFYFFYLLYIRMSRKTLNFDDKKIRKSDFYKNKNISRIDDIYVTKILVSKKELYDNKNSLKYFIGYNHDNNVMRPLCIWLLQMTGYARKFDKNETISFRVNDKQLLKNYNKIWKKK